MPVLKSHLSLNGLFPLVLVHLELLKIFFPYVYDFFAKYAKSPSFYFCVFACFHLQTCCSDSSLKPTITDYQEGRGKALPILSMHYEGVIKEARGKSRFK